MSIKNYSAFSLKEPSALDFGLGNVPAEDYSTGIPDFKVGTDGYNLGTDTTKLFTNADPNATPWYQNSSLLSNYAGLGSALASLAALPSQIEYANAQTDALKHNLSTAKEEQARRNKNISSFNAAGARNL